MQKPSARPSKNSPRGPAQATQPDRDAQPDLWALYARMLRSRLFEEAVATLWEKGLISGEMHLGTGEEAILAGVISHLGPRDAMAVDHRGTAAFLMRGVDPVLLLREMLGRPDGLCGGRGGHMHLYSKEHLAASSGIVGASGPAACGFALAAQHLRPGSVAIALFGEGAMAQGMLLESLHLAAVWNLPVVFVCKDDGWAITTRAQEAARGNLRDRVRGLGVRYLQVDGLEVKQVWQVARGAIEGARTGQGPALIHARCVHLEGHFLGFPLLRLVRRPLRELPREFVPLLRSLLHPRGAPLGHRLAGLRHVLSSLIDARRSDRGAAALDPLRRARARLAGNAARLEELERELAGQVQQILSQALGESAA